MEIVIPEVGRIEDDILLIKDDTLREKLLNVNRLVAKIEALKDNPVPSSVVVTKSTSTFPNLFLEETNTFDNSLPESETFCFNLEEPSSGSPTTPSDLSLPDYEAFSNDHIQETSSGSPTTPSDLSLPDYEAFSNDHIEETSSGSPTTPSDLSLPDYEAFSNDHIEEPSSGSPTTHSELSLPDYKAFYIDNDHFKEKSSGSTTTHVDFSQYDSFIFDLSNDQFPPADRSDFYHEEFADELAQIISQPEYDCFFKDEPELGNFTMDVVGNIFQTR
ncbi:hypothetical protein Tco_0160286, partial [Tanacetum coccineum]